MAKTVKTFKKRTESTDRVTLLEVEDEGGNRTAVTHPAKLHPIEAMDYLKAMAEMSQPAYVLFVLEKLLGADGLETLRGADISEDDLTEISETLVDVLLGKSEEVKK